MQTDTRDEFKTNYYLCLKVRFFTKKLLYVTTVSNASGPIMRKKYINLFLDLQELVHIKFTHMIHCSATISRIGRSFIVSCQLIDQTQFYYNPISIRIVNYKHAWRIVNYKHAFQLVPMNEATSCPTHLKYNGVASLILYHLWGSFQI